MNHHSGGHTTSTLAVASSEPGGRANDNGSIVGTVGIPSTDSSQHLIVDSDSTGTNSVAGGPASGSTQSVRRYGDHRRPGVSSAEWFAVIVLCFVNLINYMDRFTIAGEWVGD